MTQFTKLYTVYLDIPLGAPARAEIRRVRLGPSEPDLGYASVGKWANVRQTCAVAALALVLGSRLVG